MKRFHLLWLLLLTYSASVRGAEPVITSARVNLTAIPEALFLPNKGGASYRDPAAVFHNGWFYLYFTVVKKEAGKGNFLYTAWSKSRDLVSWSEPVIFTPRDQKLNYSSPGNILRLGDEWLMCLQTYPTPGGEKFATDAARLYTMRSKDLENWGQPELLRVKGPNVAEADMGRMIDPYLLADKDEPGKWWCFFKQNGVSMSWSRDLKNWTFEGATKAGENACVILDNGDYVLYHSPRNGIGMKRSKDLKTWRDKGVIMLGAREWPWAKDRRITAGFVLDMRKDPAVGKALMFFHVDNAGLGIAWSEDLITWIWPGKGISPGDVKPNNGDVKPNTDSPTSTEKLKPTLADVRYGSHPRQRLHFWKAQADKPTPLVFFIHGGSWMKGDRMEVERRGLAEYLKAGISVVSIEYRLIWDGRKAKIQPPVQYPLNDAARALQFVRSKAGEWGIDKTRVAVSGVSAGACSALWLAVHDEMAKPNSEDPVERESTRVTCAGVFDAQTTLDPKITREWIPNATYGAHAFGFFKTTDGKESPDFEAFLKARDEVLPHIKEYSPLEWAGAGDPPVCSAYATAARRAGEPQRDPTHAPVFSLKLKEKLAGTGVECHVLYPGAATGAYASPIKFIISKLSPQ